MSIQKMYSLTDLEDILGVTHRTLQEWVKVKKLPAVKIGGRWKVKESDLQRIIDGEGLKNNS